MPWSGTVAPYGFGEGPDSWLPMPDDWAELTVQAQDADPESTLNLYRRALRLRHELPGLRGHDLTWVPAPAGCLAYRRGDLSVWLNAGDAPDLIRTVRSAGYALDAEGTA